MKKIVLLAFVSVLLPMSMLGSRLIIPVSGSTTHHVYPEESIQDAINSAQSGDTILVHAGIYYENVVVNKTVSLIGESKESTIVDGSGENCSVFKVTVSNVVIDKFTVQNSSCSAGTSYAGIKVLGHACNITGNYVTKNKIGIFMTSQKSRIERNSVTNNGHGISLYSSSEVTVKANNLSANTVGISLASSFDNTIVDNKVANSSFGGHGIYLCSNSFNNTIFSNDLTNNYHGMWLSTSSNNWIIENNIANNELLGIELANSPNNTFYHNSFINNPTPIRVDNKSKSIWDDGYPSGGNYWSDYTDTDLYYGPYQNETGSDGIWDHPYVIDGDNQDNYPIVPEFPSFLILPLFMIATQLTVIVYRRKHST